MSNDAGSFTLPVRVRDFEWLYKSERVDAVVSVPVWVVESDEDEEASEDDSIAFVSVPV